ncbi:MAG: efflux RND transporter periplasmic adaptor subunit [Nevskia sp.]|nr:efflux RND transporter periplasmic adaptor subunit [Nevskia sp.]
MSAMQRGLEQVGRLRLSGKIAALLAVVLVAALWVASSHRGQAKPADAAAAPPPLELANADVAVVSLSQLSRSLPVSGSLSPLVQTTVKSKVAGDVLELTVREGQPVKQGEVLARIDTRYLKATLDSQEASLEKARADLALAKLNRDNSEAMLKEHFISQNAYDSAASTYAADLATVKAAEAQAALARLSWNDAVVRAPFSGTVVNRLVQPGERVEVDGGIVSLVDLSQMEFRALAPASEVPSIKVGQVAHFKVGGFGERMFDGRVDRINPMTEQGSRSITIYLSVPNPDAVLRGGMFAQGSLVLDKSEPAPAIPAAAVRNEAGVPYVLVFADGKIGRRAVTLGLGSEDQGAVEVRDGLKPGEQVLLAKLDDFKEGMAAVLKGDAPAKDAAGAAAVAKNLAE